MSTHSKIEWTDATWNPVRGCSKISAGCKHCYAEVFAERWRGIPGHPYEQGFDLRLVPEKLLEPLSWVQPRMIFVNSMSDLFQTGVPFDYIDHVMDVMELASWHVFQVLTKRAHRMREFVVERRLGLSDHRNIWMGVSVENKRHGLPRIADLQATPAAVRFLSIEPLLEDLGELDLAGIHWVIVGGESGRGARPMQQDWVISIRDQCKAAKVPFFFKQWGGVQKKRHGRKLEGRTWDGLPPLEHEISPPLVKRREIQRQALRRMGDIHGLEQLPGK
ncbi:MAG: phage Gp37/Gp68 family protein [Alphaproteobacteria bacterium]|nr:phage Gp37/Gp68 family protein [Alphaproteobacteria bacterium]